MPATPIRVATALLSERIFAGRPTKDGKGFKEPQYDVTSDVLQAIRDKVGIGNEISVECNGVVEFRISVLRPRKLMKNAMKLDLRCIEGRLFRHDPQPDDPYLETDVGKCPECDGSGCEKDINQ